MINERYSRICFLKGQSLDDCFILIEYSLYEDFKDAEEMDWSLIHLINGERIPLLHGHGEVDDLWVSLAGTVYIVARPQTGYGLHVGQPTPEGYRWNLQESVRSETTYVQNVWGLSEGTVICWGGGVLQPSLPNPKPSPVQLDTPTCWMKQEQNWIQYPSPGWVYAIGGQSADALIAVGHDRLIAYWNGQTWKKDLYQPALDLSFIQVLPTGEIYGASYYGRIFKRTETEWKEIGEHLGNIYGLVVWQGKLLAATGQGIYRIEGDMIRIERPYINARRIWGGKTLLWSDETKIYEFDGSVERYRDVL